MDGGWVKTWKRKEREPCSYLWNENSCREMAWVHLANRKEQKAGQRGGRVTAWTDELRALMGAGEADDEGSSL